MDTCETISESTIQLVFQVSIVMPSILNPSSDTPITTLQILVLARTLIMASKGPAEEFLAAKMKMLKHEDKKNETERVSSRTDRDTVKNQSQGFTQCFCLKTDVAHYHEMGIGRKIRLISKTSI